MAGTPSLVVGPGSTQYTAAPAPVGSWAIPRGTAGRAISITP